MLEAQLGTADDTDTRLSSPASLVSVTGRKCVYNEAKISGRTVSILERLSQNIDLHTNKSGEF